MLIKGYRKDIDGLRAIAVLAVILFHLGYLPNGYLGVDIFFVISGYLITGIIVNEVTGDGFSLRGFYLRRIRRIIPLVMFINVVALLVGVAVMLPDDLENLSQSVVATNLFSNNVLQFVTTKNYWDIVNEYKPLMHTWSLGVEEQFYLFYPFIFILLGKKGIRFLLPVLLIITFASFLLFFGWTYEPARFYLIPFRLFELSVGGLAVCLFRRKLFTERYAFVPILFLISLFVVDLPNSILIPLTVIASLAVLLSANSADKVTSWVLENSVIVAIGKISFSLYMWHQLVLAFARYFVMEEIGPRQSLWLLVIIVCLSVFTYYVVEQPFRDPRKISTGTLLWTLSIIFLATTSSSLYLYANAGVTGDVPELGISAENVQRNMHAQYNSRVYSYDKEFSDEKSIKVLVVGNSFARDWVNVLLESRLCNAIEVSYVFDLSKCPTAGERLRGADYVFFFSLGKAQLDRLVDVYDFDVTKAWIVGTKNFGVNNGIFYNRKDDGAYCDQRTRLEDGYIVANERLKRQFPGRYIDLIGMVIDENGTVPVFTSDCKFISQDCRHLTRSGARYYAQLLERYSPFPIDFNNLQK